MLKQLEAIARKLLPERIQRIIGYMRRPFLGYPLIIPFHATFVEDGLVSSHNVEFVTEPKFKLAYDKAVAENLYVSPDVHWRLHVACWAGSQALKLEGDFVECGVNKGFMSRVVMDYLDFDEQQRKFYLLDTFQGFDESYLTLEEQKSLQEYAVKSGSKNPWIQGSYEPCYDVVVRAFSRFSNVRIVKGVVPDTLAEVTSEKVAYLSIDMNCVAPEIAAIEYFWPKLVRGGIVILDDYGWPAHTAQKHAMDNFAREAGISILTLPTGQGLIVKF